MSAKFKPVGRINPRDLTLPMKYYPLLVSGDDVQFEDIVDLIKEMSSISEGDVQSVLYNLLTVIEIQLKYGRPVRLGDLGTLRLTLSGEGTDTPEELTSSHIRNANLRFSPGKRIKKILRMLDFEKVNGNGDLNGQSEHATADVEIKKKDA